MYLAIYVLVYLCFQFMVDRIHNNYALQIVANTFLANPTTSATFATILVEYLLARLEEMGCKLYFFLKRKIDDIFLISVWYLSEAIDPLYMGNP